MHRDVELQGIVLDLRNNPGGILSEAIDIVGLFVPKGSEVVSTRSRAEDAESIFRTEEDPLFPDTPVVILVNRFSASASEIVAGALQDYDRAVIVGETTFGKGLVQIMRPLPHNTSLKLTISHYFLPSGRTIHSSELNSSSVTVATPIVLEHTTTAGRLVRGGLGVEPDVKIDTGKESELERALLQESAFFLFADRWVADRCEAGESCTGSDRELFTAFRAWLDQSGIKLVTQADLLLSEFEASAIEEGYSSLSEKLDDVRAAMEAEKRADFDTISDRILAHLKSEIRARLLDENEQAVADILQDTWIDRAQELVGRPREIRRILSSD